MSDMELEFSQEVVETEAPSPRMIVLDKRLAEALELLGVKVRE